MPKLHQIHYKGRFYSVAALYEAMPERNVSLRTFARRLANPTYRELLTPEEMASDDIWHVRLNVDGRARQKR